MEFKNNAKIPYHGRLGRTTLTSVTVRSVSGATFPASVPTTVNAKESPELKDALIKGTLFEVTCPITQKPHWLALPVRYHDEALGLFALVLPEGLRHEEFRHRVALLEELAAERDVIPAYVREFVTVFGGEGLLEAERLAQAQAHAAASVAAPLPAVPASEPAGLADDSKPPTTGAQPRLTLKGLGSLSAADVTAAAQIAEEQAASARAKEELEVRRRELEDQFERLKVERAQLDEVAGRLERERQRMEEVEVRIVAERAVLEDDKRAVEAARQEIAVLRAELAAAREELERERMAFAAKQLNEEAAKLREAQGMGPDVPQEEKTQVVTDDQFIEAVSGGDLGASSEEVDLLFDEAELVISTELDAVGPDEMTHVTQLPDMQSLVVAARFDGDRSGGRDFLIGRSGSHVVASARCTRKQVEMLLDGAEGTLSMFVQYFQLENYPLVALLLARLDERGQAIESLAWPLDVASASDRAVLDALSERCALRFAFYERKGTLLKTWDLAAPLESNVRWIWQRAEERLTDPTRKAGMFGRAVDAYLSKDFERLSTMRHNFHADSFADAKTPSKVKLAAGIVGYWSGEDMFELLIANRSFPLHMFEAIQRRVVERALEMGIYLNQPLRAFARGQGLVGPDMETCKRLLTNFAERCVGLKPSDLNPLEQWENWDALLTFAEEIGYQPEPEILELAEASLRRAQEYEDGLEAAPAELPEREESTRTVIKQIPMGPVSKAAAPATPPGAPAAPALVSKAAGDLVVARVSENTGVTYFLPEGEVLDQFDSLATMSREDLSLLLKDANGRLEAAQMLVERFGAPVVQQVLEASEQMSAPEVEALARFIAERADGLEGELVRCVEAGGPSATYVGARALVEIKSASAIPVLLSALRDPARAGNRSALADVLVAYGERLMGPLTGILRQDGHDEALLELLERYERVWSGTLDKLARDRNKRVREAARLARR
jgi:hypothetical protein